MLPLDAEVRIDAGAHRVGELIEVGPDFTVTGAYNVKLGREEAFKIYHDIDGLDPEVVEAEVRRFGALRLCGLPRVLGMGMLDVDEELQPVAVFERLTGPSLQGRLEGGRTLRPLQVVRLALQVLNIHNEVHRAGLSVGPLPTRDLLFERTLSGERMRIARYHVGSIGDELPRTAIAALLETQPECVAPEQLLGGALSVPADLFSVGVWMYEALAGQLPYPGGGAELSRAYRRGTPPAEWPLWAMVPAALTEVVDRAIRLEPEARYTSAAEFAEALQAVPLDTLLPSEPPSQRAEIKRMHASTVSVAGPQRPVLWAFIDGPEFRKPNVEEALRRLEGEIRLVRMGRAEREAWLNALANEAQPAPHAVLFGDMHVLLDDNLLAEIVDMVETSRVLVSGHVNVELIHSSISRCGLDSHVLAGMEVDEIVDHVRRAYQRAATIRQRFPTAGTVPSTKKYAESFAEEVTDRPRGAAPLTLEVLT